MPGYSGIDGQKWETEEDIFDQMVEMLRLFDTTNEPPLASNSHCKPNNTYNKKPLDPDYFSKCDKTTFSNPSNSLTADEQSVVTPYCRNISKRSGAWENEISVDDTMICFGNAFALNSNPKPRKSNRPPIPQNYESKERMQGWTN